MPISERLEQFINGMYLKQHNSPDQAKVPECPPIDPQLLAHLDYMFQYPVAAKAGHPQLGQLLTVQFGIEKVLSYLKEHYEHQTAVTRGEF